MIHAREDYNRFQDPENKIPEDEPVMLFRAQDRHFIDVLCIYREMLILAKNHEVADAISKHIDTAKIWQQKNKTKEPDL